MVRSTGAIVRPGVFVAALLMPGLAGAAEVWVPPEGIDGRPDAWAAVNGRDATFVFGVPDDLREVEHAEVVVVGQRAGNFSWTGSVAIAAAGERTDAYVDTLPISSARSTAGELLALPVTPLLGGEVYSGADHVSLEFQTTKRGSAIAVVGLRVTYETTGPAELECDPHEVVSWTGDAWACEVNHLSRAEVRDYVTDAAIDLAAGSSMASDGLATDTELSTLAEDVSENLASLETSLRTDFGTDLATLDSELTDHVGARESAIRSDLGIDLDDLAETVEIELESAVASIASTLRGEFADADEDLEQRLDQRIDGLDETYAAVGRGVPLGTVIDWWRPEACEGGSWATAHPDLCAIPDGYALADGATVDDPDSPLHGTALPDLRGRFVRGVADAGYAGVDTGGSSSHDHEVDFPRHRHSTSIDHSHHIKGRHNHHYASWRYRSGAWRWTAYKSSGSVKNLNYWGNGIGNAGTDHYPLYVRGKNKTALYTNKVSIDETVSLDADRKTTWHDPSAETTTTGSNLPPFVGLLKLVRVR